MIPDRLLQAGRVSRKTAELIVSNATVLN